MPNDGKAAKNAPDVPAGCCCLCVTEETSDVTRFGNIVGGTMGELVGGSVTGMLTFLPDTQDAIISPNEVEVVFLMVPAASLCSEVMVLLPLVGVAVLDDLFVSFVANLSAPVTFLIFGILRRAGISRCLVFEVWFELTEAELGLLLAVSI